MQGRDNGVWMTDERRLTELRHIINDKVLIASVQESQRGDVLHDALNLTNTFTREKKT